MTSNGNGARLTTELRAARWAEIRRTGTGHVLYKCPCGRHFATVTASRTRDSGRPGPIEARIRRCNATLQDQALGTGEV